MRLLRGKAIELMEKAKKKMGFEEERGIRKEVREEGG